MDQYEFIKRDEENTDILFAENSDDDYEPIGSFTFCPLDRLWYASFLQDWLHDADDLRMLADYMDKNLKTQPSGDREQ